MYNIYVFEDNRQDADTILFNVHLYSEKNPQFKIERISYFNKNFENFIYDKTRKSDSHNLYLIDIELKSKWNGIQLANEIRKNDFLGYIIILSNHDDLKEQLFEYSLKAINFIYKSAPNAQEKLFKTLEKISMENQSLVNVQPRQENTIQFKYLSNYYSVPINEILFVEKSYKKRGLDIHTRETCLFYPARLSDFEKIMPLHFTRCHKSFIVNTLRIRKIERTGFTYAAILSNDKSCCVSKGYLDEVVKIMYQRNEV